LYEMLKSLIISGIAGNNIVSPYMVIRREEPNIESVIHAEVGIFVEEDNFLVLLLSGGGEVGDCSVISIIHFRYNIISNNLC
jgi:hypothetical protein